MGGWLNTSCIVVSIRAIASVRYREVVRSWEGPLWEVPLYYIVYRDFITTLTIEVLNSAIIQNFTFSGAFISQI